MTISQLMKTFNAEIVFEFPCASDIILSVITSVGAKVHGVSEGYTGTVFSEMGRFQSFTFTPTEDDTYIYEIEVKIEQQ